VADITVLEPRDTLHAAAAAAAAAATLNSLHLHTSPHPVAGTLLMLRTSVLAPPDTLLLLMLPPSTLHLHTSSTLLQVCC
jgi:hypothetical protein